MQLLNLFYLVLLTIQSLSAEQPSWFSNGKAFLARHKKVATRVLQAALRRPSIATAVAAVGSALYNRAPKARAETIFVARDTEGNPRDITPEEHEKLYDIKLKSQFPTAQCYTDYDPTANEIEVIQKKVDATFGDKNIEAVWVPDTVYGLAGTDIAGHDHSYMAKEPKTTQDMCVINKDPQVKKLDLAVNNTIVRKITPVLAKKSSLKFIAINDWNHLAGQMLQEHEKSALRKVFYTTRQKDLIEKSIDAEQKVKAHNQFLLWRGVGGTNEFGLIKKDSNKQYEALQHSLSYGSSLLGGCRYGPGDCALNYMKGKKGVGYSLPISKKEYINAGQNHWMYVPPISQAASVLSKGENFHPRLKFAEEMKKRDIIGDIASEQKMTGDRAAKQQQIKDFLYYLSRYHQPLKSK